MEKVGDTVEEKVKRYTDIFTRVQECEAQLSSATDKGEYMKASREQFIDHTLLKNKP